MPNHKFSKGRGISELPFPEPIPLHRELPPLAEYGDENCGLPDGFPVQPLGQNSGNFYFLTARGELVGLAARVLAHRSNLVALMVGVPDAIGWLEKLGAPKCAKDVGFNAPLVGDRLMRSCASLPLFDRRCQFVTLALVAQTTARQWYIWAKKSRPTTTSRAAGV